MRNKSREEAKSNKGGNEGGAKRFVYFLNFCFKFHFLRVPIFLLHKHSLYIFFRCRAYVYNKNEFNHWTEIEFMYKYFDILEKNINETNERFLCVDPPVLWNL